MTYSDGLVLLLHFPKFYQGMHNALLVPKNVLPKNVHVHRLDIAS